MLGVPVGIIVKDTHGVLSMPIDKLEPARGAIAGIRPDVRVMSSGEIIEIYKEVGLPKDVASRFDISAMSGRHGIGLPAWPPNPR